MNMKNVIDMRKMKNRESTYMRKHMGMAYTKQIGGVRPHPSS